MNHVTVGRREDGRGTPYQADVTPEQLVDIKRLWPLAPCVVAEIVPDSSAYFKKRVVSITSGP